MGVELCFVHPSCPVDFEMNQDFNSSFYEQAKNVIYENKQTKTKAICTQHFSVTSVNCLHPHVTVFQTVLI